MSFSNLNNQGLPDIQDLEALANQFFKGLNHDEHLVIHDHISSVLNPDTSTIFSSNRKLIALKYPDWKKKIML